jgi:hypothetical protein
MLDHTPNNICMLFTKKLLRISLTLIIKPSIIQLKHRVNNIKADQIKLKLSRSKCGHTENQSEMVTACI